jgi:hypothetical protein
MPENVSYIPDRFPLYRTSFPVMKKFLFIILATAVIVFVAFVLQNGSNGAGKHLHSLVEALSGKSHPSVAKPAILPPPTTPEPIVAVQPPPATPAPRPTPAPVATPTPAPVVAATPDPNEPGLILKSLAASRDEWPHQVQVKKAVAFPVVVNGAVAGNVEVPRGGLVDLVAYGSEKVALSFQGASQTVSIYDTDLIERVRENRRHGIIPNKPKVVAAAATPTATPDAQKSLFFANLKTTAKATPKVTLPASVAALVAEAEALAPNPENKYEVDSSLREEWKDKAKRYMELPVDQVTAHPAAARFPGSVPADAPRVKREFTFALNMPRWQSTGLYAAPGEKVTVHVSPQDAARGLSVVVGAQSDHIFSRDKWPRFPIISRRFKITEPHTVVANAFGGLIYIDIPRDKAMGGYNVSTYGGYGWLDEDPNAIKGSVRVSIEGGVEAASYAAGKTKLEDWQKIKHSPAPWGELASSRIILTLPSSVLKTIEDPAPLLAYWDQVVDLEDALVGWPKRQAPPERIVPDLEISAGFMHSGYPIMCEWSALGGITDLRKLKTIGAWGFFHELGHNHEAQAATFGGDYVEVNVNFCSLYVTEMLVKKDMTAGHPALGDLDKLLHARLGSEKKTEAFENLAMYVLPIRELGWPAFQQTISSYSAPDGGKGIKTREDKMDQWVLRYSQNTGMNLVPYFEAFDVTCSEKTKEALKKLPVWLPNPNFPKNYQK